jgi:hypothetical protein
MKPTITRTRHFEVTHVEDTRALVQQAPVVIRGFDPLPLDRIRGNTPSNSSGLISEELPKAVVPPTSSNLDHSSAINFARASQYLHLGAGAKPPNGVSDAVKHYETLVTQTALPSQMIKHHNHVIGLLPVEESSSGENITRMNSVTLKYLKNFVDSEPLQSLHPQQELRYAWQNLPIGKLSTTKQSYEAGQLQHFTRTFSPTTLPAPSGFTQLEAARKLPPQLRPLAFEILANKCPPQYRILLQNEALKLSNGGGAAILARLAESEANLSERATLHEIAYQESLKLPHGASAGLQLRLAKTAVDPERRTQLKTAARVQALAMPNGVGAAILEQLWHLASTAKERDELWLLACKAALAMPHGAGAPTLVLLSESTKNVVDHAAMRTAALARVPLLGNDDAIYVLMRLMKTVRTDSPAPRQRNQEYIVIAAAANKLPNGAGALLLEQCVYDERDAATQKILLEHAGAAAVRMPEGTGAPILLRLDLREEARRAASAMSDGAGGEVLWELAKTAKSQRERVALRVAANGLPHGMGAEALASLSESTNDTFERAELRKEASAAAIVMPHGSGADLLMRLAASSKDSRERRLLRSHALTCAQAIPNGEGSYIFEELAKSKPLPYERRLLHKIAVGLPNGRGAVTLLNLAFSAESGSAEQARLVRDAAQATLHAPSEVQAMLQQRLQKYGVLLNAAESASA